MSAIQDRLSKRFNEIFPRTTGTLYDLVVFAFAFVLPWLLQPVGDFIHDLISNSKPAAGAMMLAVMALQLAGGIWKRKAMHHRVAHSSELFENALRSEGLISVLIGLYWLLMTYIGMTAVIALTDWPAGPGMGTTFALATIVTVAVGYAAWLPGVKQARGSKSPEGGGLDFERIADACLMISALIVMYAVWQPFAGEIMSGEGHIRREASSSWAGTIVYTIVIALPFATFYIAPRLLFFVEDARARGTWIRFALIYLFAAWRMFFG